MKQFILSAGSLLFILSGVNISLAQVKDQSKATVQAREARALTLVQDKKLLEDAAFLEGSKKDTTAQKKMLDDYIDFLSQYSMEPEKKLDQVRRVLNKRYIENYTLAHLVAVYDHSYVVPAIPSTNIMPPNLVESAAMGFVDKDDVRRTPYFLAARMVSGKTFKAFHRQLEKRLGVDGPLQASDSYRQKIKDKLEQMRAKVMNSITRDILNVFDALFKKYKNINAYESSKELMQAVGTMDSIAFYDQKGEKIDKLKKRLFDADDLDRDDDIIREANERLTDVYGNSLLHIAVVVGNMKAVVNLIQYGAPTLGVSNSGIGFIKAFGDYTEKWLKLIEGYEAPLVSNPRERASMKKLQDELKEKLKTKKAVWTRDYEPLLKALKCTDLLSFYPQSRRPSSSAANHPRPRK